MIELLPTQLGLHLNKLSNVQLRPVCIEAAHIYMDEEPTLRHEIGAMVGARLATIIEEMGFPVERMLFIDDYNASSQDLDIGAYRQLISEHGFASDTLVMESSLVEQADHVIALLEQQGMTEVTKQGATILKKNYKKDSTIVLKKSPDRGAIPACAALDAALYLRKYEQSGICITVLHEEWKGQQDGVKKVLQTLGANIPIFEVYYNDVGDVDVEFDY